MAWDFQVTSPTKREGQGGLEKHFGGWRGGGGQLEKLLWVGGEWGGSFESGMPPCYNLEW